MATAQSLIRDLVASGLNKSQIARRLGRDSSLIGQIEKGKKPGRNLVEPLEAIKRGAAKAQPERRKTKSGEAAKVRQSKTLKVKTLKRDSQGRIKLAEPTDKEYVSVRRLREIAGAGGKVSIRLTFPDGTTKVLYQRGGEYAATLLYQYENSGQSFFEFLGEKAEEFAERQYSGIGDFLESPVAVGFIAIYTAAKDI